MTNQPAPQPWTVPRKDANSGDLKPYLMVLSDIDPPALRGRCEVETCGVDFKQAGIRRHVDHIVPARLIRRLKAGNPDRRENLQCICATCHGYKLQADHKLCLGDQLGYLEISSYPQL
jgi:hypothetical protein